MSDCSNLCAPNACSDAIALTSIGTPGIQGPAGETVSLIIGSVTTGANAGATLTLIQVDPPVYSLSLVLPVGQTQIYANDQTFNGAVIINGLLTIAGNGTITGTVTTSTGSVFNFGGSVLMPNLPMASASDCISGRLVSCGGQLKLIQNFGINTYLGVAGAAVVKVYTSLTDTDVGQPAIFSTACATAAQITVYLTLLNDPIATPTPLSYYTFSIYDGATLISAFRVSNYDGGGSTFLPVNLAAGNHSIQIKVAGTGIGAAGGSLMIDGSAIRVDV